MRALIVSMHVSVVARGLVVSIHVSVVSMHALVYVDGNDLPTQWLRPVVLPLSDLDTCGESLCTALAA